MTDARAFHDRAIARMRRVVVMMEDEFPDADTSEHVIILAAAAGTFLARDAFPGRPDVPLLALVQTIGSAVGLELKRLSIEQQKDCQGTA